MNDDALRAKVRAHLDPYLLPSHLAADTSVVVNALSQGWETVTVPASHTRLGVWPLKVHRGEVVSS